MNPDDPVGWYIQKGSSSRPAHHCIASTTAARALLRRKMDEQARMAVLPNALAGEVLIVWTPGSFRRCKVAVRSKLSVPGMGAAIDLVFGNRTPSRMQLHIRAGRQELTEKQLTVITHAGGTELLEAMTELWVFTDR